MSAQQRTTTEYWFECDRCAACSPPCLSVKEAKDEARSLEWTIRQISEEFWAVTCPKCQMEANP